MPDASCDIGLIGLAVMGQNLVLNMNDHGFKVAVFNRTVSKVDDFIAHEAKGTQVVGAHSVQELASLLKRPRRVMLMVKAGASVDETIGHLLPYLEAGDIIIDGGNSLFTDSNRRTAELARKAFSSSAPASPAAKRAHAAAPRSCPAAIPPHGPT
jgi:6-phosphogluconate dehydrogenase